MIELVGEGAMAFVWKARQESLDRTVAIKMLRPEIASNPAYIKDFLREARAAAALKHPGIVQIYDIAERHGDYYLVLEYIDGPSVASVIARQGPLPVKRALAIARAVAEALEYAWNREKLIHRDIKPHNVLIDADGAIKLSDLGLARTATPARGADKTLSILIEGTPNFISPEQARGETNVDCRSDMYSLGASLYHMVTGVMPFGDLAPMEAVQQQVSGRLPNPRDLAPDLPMGVVQLITRLMMRAPEERFGTWADASEAIRRVATGRLLLTNPQTEGLSTIAPPADAADAGVQPRGRRRAVSAADRPNIPAWFRLLAVAGMGVILIGIGIGRMRQPAYIPIPEKKYGGNQAPPTGAVINTQQPRSISTTPSADQAPRTGDTPPSATTTNPAAAEAHGNGETWKDTLIANLLAEDFAKAEKTICAALRTEPPAAAGTLQELRDFVVQVAAMPEAIVAEFMRHVGTKVTIVHNKQPHSVLLRSIAAGKVNGRMDTADGSVPVQFQINQLNPVERSRWLSQESSAAANAMRCILNLKGGQVGAARALLPRCGPLTPLLEHTISQHNGAAPATGSSGP